MTHDIPTASTTTLVGVKSDVFPPAIGELVTAAAEHVPIFSPAVLADAYAALSDNAIVYVRPKMSKDGRTRYAADVQVVDPTASDMPCIFCGSGSAMYRTATAKVAFRCIRCHGILNVKVV